MKQSRRGSTHHPDRRKFLKGGVLAAGAATVGAGLFANRPSAFGEERSGRLTPGDTSILRFLAAAEILETDLWQQYNELGGIQDSEVPRKTRATLDTSTSTYRNRYFVQYSLSVDVARSAGTVDLFDSRTGDRFAGLIGIDGSSIIVRLPLRALNTGAPARVTLEDANRPGSFSPTLIELFAR